MRRGKPCAHTIFGIPATINSANYVYFEALKDCQQLNMQAVTVYMDELLHLHRGQAMDIFWRDNVVCPTEEQYLDMVQQKTGGLFRLAIGLMQSASTVKDINFVPLVNKLAVLFQILDDYLNLHSAKYHTNKSFCEDLTEGKFSFPVIHCIVTGGSDSRLLNIVRQKPTDHNIKAYALEVMKETNSFEYTKKVLKQAEQECLAMIAELGGNVGVTMIVKALMSELETCL